MYISRNYYYFSILIEDIFFGLDISNDDKYYVDCGSKGNVILF